MNKTNFGIGRILRQPRRRNNFRRYTRSRTGRVQNAEGGRMENKEKTTSRVRPSEKCAETVHATKARVRPTVAAISRRRPRNE